MVGRGEWVLRLVPPLRRSLDQVSAHRLEWDRRATELLAGEREGDPLWVVLGDSTAQAVGLADIEDGYVERVRRTGREADVIGNLLAQLAQPSLAAGPRGRMLRRCRSGEVPFVGEASGPRAGSSERGVSR